MQKVDRYGSNPVLGATVSDINFVILTGRLVTNAMLVYTTDEQPLAHFDLVVARHGDESSTDRRWVAVAGERAEVLAKRIRIDDRVLVVGHMFDLEGRHASIAATRVALLPDGFPDQLQQAVKGFRKSLGDVVDFIEPESKD